MITNPLTFYRSRTLGGLIAALGSLAIAACGTTVIPGVSTPSSGSGSNNSQFTSIQNSVNQAKNATFKAVYTSNSGGTTSTVTLEQMPPNSLFSESDGGEIISQGSTVYYCSSNGDGTNSCVTEPSSDNPLAGIEGLYNGQTFLALMQSTQSELGLHLAGVSIDYSNATYAGQASTCMNISAQGQSTKYCVTNSGILAYEGSASSSFQLTSYTTNVSASDFQPPAGSSTTTIPAIPSNGYGTGASPSDSSSFSIPSVPAYSIPATPAY